VPLREMPNVNAIENRVLAQVPPPSDGGLPAAAGQAARRADTALYNLLLGKDLYDGRRRAIGEGRVGETRAARTQILGAIHTSQRAS